MNGFSPAVAAATSAAPCFIYDAELFESRVGEVLALVDEYLYPIKANPEPAIVCAALRAGAGLDLCSRGDLDIAASCGADLSGCGFTSANLDASLAAELLASGVSVDLDSLDQVGTWLAVGGRSAGLRLCTANAQSAYGSKFGLTRAGVDEAASTIADSGGRVTRLHVHDAHADRTPDLMVEQLLEILGSVPGELLAACDQVNIGGGWPMPDGMPTAASALAGALARVRAHLSDLGFHGRLAAEPGEWAVGPCGWLAARITAVKPHPAIAGRLVVVLDTATPVPCRPSRAPFALLRDGACIQSSEMLETACDVYGSANTGLDTVGVDVRIPRPLVGDVLVSSVQGAYARQLTGSFNERSVPSAVALG